MKRQDCYRKICEAVATAISKALDGDDMFDNDNDFSMEDDTADAQDSSMYVNHDKDYFTVADYIRRGWRYDGDIKLFPSSRAKTLSHSIDMDDEKFFRYLVVDYEKLSDDVKALIDENNMIKVILRCAVFYDNDNFLNGRRYHVIDLAGKQNYISNECDHVLCKRWFDECLGFNEYGYAKVKVRYKCNALDMNGNLWSKEWFKDVVDISDVSMIVRLSDDNYNFIDRNGNMMFSENLKRASRFDDGCYSVIRSSKYGANVVRKDGSLLSDTWFFVCYSPCRGVYKVQNDDLEINYLMQNGRLMFDEWFEDGNDYNYGYAPVMKNGKWNYLNSEGKVLLDEWCDDCKSFCVGMGVVERNGKFNMVDMAGRIVSDIWFDEIEYDSMYPFATVKTTQGYNMMDKSGRLLSDVFFDEIRTGVMYRANSGSYKGVRIQGKDYWFGMDGNLYEEDADGKPHRTEIE